MIAVIITGGKQYKVQENEFVSVEKLANQVGETVKLQPLLVIDGENTISDVKDLSNFEVNAEVVEQGKNDKIVVFKYKAKKNERKHQGHRQPFTKLKIVSIKKI